jgi:hypothetical protein
MATLEELRRDHPEWNVVSVVDAPGGGQLAVGADGGVFALGGARYADTSGGSYQGYLNQAGLAGRESRTFGAGSISATNTGYTLQSTTGDRYTFNYNQPAATAPATTPTPAPAGTVDPNAPANQSARGLIASTLAAVGLPTTLADSLWNENYLNQGRPLQTITDVDLPATDAFKARFPAFDKFQAQTGGTVKDYMSQTSTYAGLMKAAGLPSGFYDSPDDFAKFMAGGVSPKEVSDRISMAKEAALTAPPAVHDYLVNQEGLDANNLAAFFLDPDKGDLVKQQALMTRGEIAGAGRAAGFSALTRAEAAGIQEQGTTGDQAAQRFGELTPMAGGIFAGQNVEEAETGGGVGRKEALGYVAGQGADEAAIAAARARRQAKFQGGGGAATGGGGRTGLS